MRRKSAHTYAQTYIHTHTHEAAVSISYPTESICRSESSGGTGARRCNGHDVPRDCSPYGNIPIANSSTSVPISIEPEQQSRNRAFPIGEDPADSRSGRSSYIPRSAGAANCSETRSPWWKSSCTGNSKHCNWFHCKGVYLKFIRQSDKNQLTIPFAGLNCPADRCHWALPGGRTFSRNFPRWRHPIPYAVNSEWTISGEVNAAISIYIIILNSLQMRLQLDPFGCRFVLIRAGKKYRYYPIRIDTRPYRIVSILFYVTDIVSVSVSQGYQMKFSKVFTFEKKMSSFAFTLNEDISSNLASLTCDCQVDFVYANLSRTHEETIFVHLFVSSSPFRRDAELRSLQNADFWHIKNLHFADNYLCAHLAALRKGEDETKRKRKK